MNFGHLPAGVSGFEQHLDLGSLLGVSVSITTIFIDEPRNGALSPMYSQYCSVHDSMVTCVPERAVIVTVRSHRVLDIAVNMQSYLYPIGDLKCRRIFQCSSDPTNLERKTNVGFWCVSVYFQCASVRIK